MIYVIHQLCMKVWESGEWPDDWTKSVFISLPKKGYLSIGSNYRTISLASHESKILLSVIVKIVQKWHVINTEPFVLRLCCLHQNVQRRLLLADG